MKGAGRKTLRPTGWRDAILDRLRIGSRLLGAVFSYSGVRTGVFVVAAVLLALSPLFTTPGFAASIGPNSPTAASGTSWTSATNVYTQNSAYASYSLSASATSNALSVTGFGFNISSSATINGVQATIYRYAPSVSRSAVKDGEIYLLKAGATTGTSQATTTTWPTANGSATYGSSTSLWGASLTPSDVNASNFGVSITATNTKTGGSGGTNTAYIDYVSVTVYYTLSSSFNQASYRLYNNQDATAGGFTYGTKATYATDAAAYDSATGDFNGDGKLDIVTINGDVAGTADVLLNNGNGTFGTKTSFSIDLGPEQVRVADFNGDGKPDIATGHYNSPGYVDVLLNTTATGATTPTFSAKTSIQLGSYLWYLAASDVNGDSKPDLLVPNGASGFTVFLNTTATGATTPTFSAGTAYSTGASSSPQGIVVGDFTGDGKVDVAVADTAPNPGLILIFPGTGTGTFGSYTSFNVGQYPYDIAAADLNGDGHLDIVAADSYDVAVLINNGSGSFTSTTYTHASYDVALADYTGDGILDIGIVDQSNNGFIIFPGKGDGTFDVSASVSYAGNYLYSINAADLNGDGKPDLVGADELDANVTVYLTVSSSTIGVGSPLANMNTATNAPTGGQPFRLRMDIGVATADLPANGQSFKLQYAPMATSCSATSGYSDVTDTSTVGYYDNPLATNGTTLATSANDPTDGTNAVNKETYQEKGTTTFTNPVAIPSGQDGMWDFALTTNNGTTGNTHYCMRIVGSSGTPLTTYTNYAEIITPPTSYAQASYRLFSNQDGSSSPGGSLSFAAKVDYPANMYSAAAISADFNKDGKQDMAVASGSSNNVSILLNNGSGGFSAKVDYPTSTDTDSLVAVDLNGDGNLDIVATNYSTGTVSVLLGTGTGTFGTKTDYPTGTNPKYIVAADFNGDGKTDVAVSDTSANTISVLLGTGTGSFGTKTDFPTNAGPQGLTAGDFNGDGKQDIAVATNTNGTVSVLLGTGTGSFGTKTDFPAGGGAEDVNAVDLNGDGKLDLVTANNTADTASVLLGTGTGSFGTKTDYTTGSGPSNTTIADFNGDGKPDLATANVNGSSVSVLPGNGTGGFGTKTDLTTNSMPEPTGVGDFNGDGKPDLAVPDYIAGYVSVLTNTTAFPASIDVGSPLAAQNTAATMATYGTPFRLRLDVGASTSGVASSGQSFKLQYAPRATTCAATSAASYVDVTGTSAMQYYDNPIATNGTSFATNVNDPTDGTNTLVRQTYQEKGTTTFTNPTAFSAGQDGMWDFALTSTAAANNTVYCFRVIKADGSSLDTYAKVPEITIGTPSVGPTLDQQLRGGQSVIGGTKAPFLF